MLLVGLGEEWIVTDAMIQEDLEKKNRDLYHLFQTARNVAAFQKLIPVFTAYYFENFIPEKLRRAYENMHEMLEGKNYFIVSLTVDSYLEKMGFEKERCVNPCGTYQKMQCYEGCHDGILSSEALMKEIETLLTKAEALEGDMAETENVLKQCVAVVDSYQCEHCGGKQSFNLLDANKYREEGYLERWQMYMKWLQGTLNRELCVIEAGVGVKHPSVIRWPFEKTVFYNQKAKMFRIHKMFYQVNEEIAERAFGCKCHSVELFSERNVEA